MLLLSEIFVLIFFDEIRGSRDNNILKKFTNRKFSSKKKKAYLYKCKENWFLTRLGEQKNYIQIIEDIQKFEKINIKNRDEFDSLPKMLMSLVYTQDAKPRILTVFLALLTLVATLIINSTKQVQNFISLIDYISTFPQFLNLIANNFTIYLY